MKKSIGRVVVGILQRSDNAVFLQKRRKTQIWGGYWEFPGGKIKDGENPAAALARELHEEIGVIVKTATPWLRRLHHYPQGKVEIHFFACGNGETRPQARKDSNIDGFFSIPIPNQCYRPTGEFGSG